MVESKSPKLILWREGWSACKRNAAEMLPWVLAFAVLISICNFYSLGDQLSAAYAKLQAIEDQSDVPDHVSPPVVRLARICAALIELVAFYYFTAVYLRREPIAARPELTAGTFISWLGQIALAALFIVGMGLAVAVAGGIIVAIISAISHNGPDPIVTMAIAVLTMLIFVYGGIKFMLVSPLAVSGMGKAVKVSWQMTRGHWWRVMWGYLWLLSVAWMVLFVVFLIPIALLFMYTPATSDSPVFIGGLSIIVALCSVITLAAGSVYCCCVARILYREERLPAAGESGSMTV